LTSAHRQDTKQRKASFTQQQGLNYFAARSVKSSLSFGISSCQPNNTRIQTMPKPDLSAMLAGCTLQSLLFDKMGWELMP
jgi:hypothetical protein